MPVVGLALDRQILPDGETVPIDASDWSLNAVIGAQVTIS
jgi:hypothetical protein